MNHRAAADTCSTDRGPGNPDPGIATTCTRDSDCTEGALGRCLVSTFGAHTNYCSYDACYTDSDCTPTTRVCGCRAAGSNAANVCLNTGNCLIDSDCGAGGYCSPSQLFSNTFFSDAYYCHTASDACVNDADCQSTASPNAACAYDTNAKHWACASFGGPPP